ncbi:MAG: hypothetical protein AB8H79_09205 [Myxococcota bacterium]
MRRYLPLLLAVAACRGEPGELRDVSDAWPTTQPYDVQEAIRYTETPYADLPGDSDGIGTLLQDLYPAETPKFAPGDGYVPANGCEGTEDRQLPMDIEGIVTLHPRWYMKLSGCNRSDEKYYGNFFIEDSTGGIFVAGDSKVAHFDVGDRVKLRVRAVRTDFDFNMIYAHDVLEISREARPLYYQWSQAGIGKDDIGETRRVRGVMSTEPDTFGQFTLTTDDGADVFINLDSELNRRRVYPEPGTQLCATGPVQYSFSEYTIVIMRIGQLAIVEGDEPCPN